ncbi:hypothetical protein EOY42_25310 [Salmonella enterica]|nr:hypothetical protein [Salmonella enterica]EBD7602391.1 hypothetical protein [Salmonella enterica]
MKKANVILGLLVATAATVVNADPIATNYVTMDAQYTAGSDLVATWVPGAGARGTARTLTDGQVIGEITLENKNSVTSVCVSGGSPSGDGSVQFLREDGSKGLKTYLTHGGIKLIPTNVVSTGTGKDCGQIGTDKKLVVRSFGTQEAFEGRYQGTVTVTGWGS